MKVPAKPRNSLVQLLWTARPPRKLCDIHLTDISCYQVNGLLPDISGPYGRGMRTRWREYKLEGGVRGHINLVGSHWLHSYKTDAVPQTC